MFFKTFVDTCVSKYLEKTSYILSLFADSNNNELKNIYEQNHSMTNVALPLLNILSYQKT